MKPIEQYVSVVLFVTLCKVVLLTFDPVDEDLMYDHSTNDSLVAVLFYVMLCKEFLTK